MFETSKAALAGIVCLVMMMPLVRVSHAASAEPLKAAVEINVVDAYGNLSLPPGLLGEWNVAIKKTFDETKLPDPFDPKGPALCRFSGVPGDYWFEDSYHHKHRLRLNSTKVADAKAQTVEAITLMIDGRPESLSQIQELTLHYDEDSDSWSGEWLVLVMRSKDCLQRIVFKCQATRVGSYPAIPTS